MKRTMLQALLLGLCLCLPLSQALAQDYIDITAPAAGAVWEVGSTQQITWDTNLTDVTIRYSTDDGATWTPIADTVDTSSALWLSYAWEVPDEPSTTCKIHIEGYYGEAPTDSATFEIAAPSSGGNGGDDNGDEEAGLCAAVTSGPTAIGLALVGLSLLFLRRRR